MNQSTAKAYVKHVLSWSTLNMKINKCVMKSGSRAGYCVIKSSKRQANLLAQKLKYKQSKDTQCDSDDIKPNQTRLLETPTNYAPTLKQNDGAWPKNQNNVRMKDMCISENTTIWFFDYPYG